jgi:hypothetical protein
MYLYVRQVRLAPGRRVDGMEWAVAMAEKVNQIAGLNVGLWTPFASPGMGTLSWGATVETLADLDAADTKLNTDPGYLELVGRATNLVTSAPDDRVAEYLYNPVPDLDATWVATVESQFANGAFARGAEVGVEIAQRATALGEPTAFLLGLTGGYASCMWVSPATSMAELEAGERAIRADSDFVAFLDREAASCYLPGVTSTSIWRRIA